MSAPRVPPWAYSVVVVACGLGTLGALHLCGVFREPRAKRGADQPTPAPAQRPSPVDPATLPPHRAAARAAALATLLPVYDSLNPDGPNQGADRAALEAYALYLAHAHPPDTLGEYVLGVLRAAGASPDPMVRYAEWRVGTDLGAPGPRPERVLGLAEELGKTKYPAVHRLRAYLDAALACPDAYAVPAAERRAAAARLTEGLWSTFAETAADPGRGSEVGLLEVARALVARDDPPGGDRHANHRRARAALEGAGAREHVRLTVDGLSAAREGLARLGGDVGRAPARLRTAARPDFERAGAALSRAWELDPQCPAAAAEMITVAFELGHGRDEVELWVRRALAPDPDNARAWANELGTLLPDRGGTVDGVIAFARRCRASGNWDGGVPQVAVAAFNVVRRARSDFFASRDGWAEAQGLFEGWLAAHPGSRAARSCYARTAVDAERYDVAVPLFEALNGRPWRGAFPDLSAYDAVVALSHRGTGRAPPQPRPFERTVAERILSERGRRSGAREARRRWFADTYREAFARLYPAPAPGHAEGLVALAAVADAEATQFPFGAPADAAWVALEKAVAAGCADPLVRTLHARFGQVTGEALDAPAHRRHKAVADLLASGYPDAVKFPAALAARSPADGTRKYLDEMGVALARCAAAREPVAQGDVLRAAVALLTAVPPELTRADIHNHLRDALAPTGGTYESLVLAGVEHRATAWELLTGPGAPARPAEFRSALLEAEALLGRAWRLAPDRPEAPTQMLAVGTGLGYPRSEIDLWFIRAVSDDPDNYEAFRWLARYCEPAWHGSANVMDLLTIRNLAHTAGQWEGAFGLLAYQVETTARYGYLRGRPDDRGIWGEVEHPLQTWLKAAPGCRYAKTVYALAAIRARQFAIADRMFQELRGNPWPGVFPSAELYREAVEETRRQLGRPRTD